MRLIAIIIFITITCLGQSIFVSGDAKVPQWLLEIVAENNLKEITPKGYDEIKRPGKIEYIGDPPGTSNHPVFTVQESGGIVSYGSQGKTLTITEYGDNPYLNQFLGCWGEYKAECYADSSEKIEHIKDCSACIIQLNKKTTIAYTDCINPNHKNKIIYIHKEPTFPGFMAWLEKKYGE